MGISANQRYKQLDSLRGVAALVVVLGHLYLTVNDDGVSGLFRTPLSPFVTGPAAVVLFFVLSGFVLSLPYASGRGRRYLAYAVGRLCRLYLPLLATVILSAALAWTFAGAAPPPALTQTFRTWNLPLSADNLVSHLALSGYPLDATRLDPPMWSLIMEVRASLLFPALFFFVWRFGLASVAAGLIVAFLCVRLKTSLGDPSTVDARDLIGTLLLTGRYLVFFLMGIACALRLDDLRAIYGKLTPALHVAACGAGVLIATMLAISGKASGGSAYLFYGCSAVYVISGCLFSQGASRLLQRPWPSWLGQVSFSLYLIHWPVILTAFYIVAPRIGAGPALILAFPMVLLAAHGMERWVERPTHNLGKWCARRLDPPPAVDLKTGEVGPGRGRPGAA
ncbi:acyltransferase [Alsobacter sp. KACC 23698]|uniref:Acyltransferase n=1 Tax=Alsobacter sp. KACC 23698 TaxID=3149229 RepID=A0AAU7JIR9_9HYPH